jgi:hypothetical protein
VWSAGASDDQERALSIDDMIQSYIHARSVLPIVYICMLGACQQISADASQSVWADSRSDRIGPPHVQSVWAECHVSSALANGFPY